jgi:hypothetical protein
MNIRDLIREHNRVINLADSKLERDLLLFQKQALVKLEAVLRQFSTVSGSLDFQSSDSFLLMKLRKELLEIFEGEVYTDSIKQYLSNFDKIEQIQKNKIIVTNKSLSQKLINSIGLTAERKLIADEVVRNLISPTAISNTFIAPIQRVLYQAVSYGATFSETETAIRTIVVGSPRSQGLISRYAKQITRDGLRQFSGSVSQKVSDRLGLNAFVFVNELLPEDSRQNCIDMINGTGAIGRFMKPGNIYLKEDLPEMIKILRNGKGWNPATTAATYFIYRNGYNCRHEAIPTSYNENFVN